MPNNQEIIKAYKEKHGPIAHAVVGGQLLVFRAPDLDEWENYQEALAKKPRGVAFREFAQVCCVYPAELESLQGALAKVPASATRISDALADLAGADLEVTVKKD